MKSKALISGIAITLLATGLAATLMLNESSKPRAYPGANTSAPSPIIVSQVSAPSKRPPDFDPALSPKPYVNPTARSLNLPCSANDGVVMQQDQLKGVLQGILGLEFPDSARQFDGMDFEVTPDDALKLVEGLMKKVKSGYKVNGVLESIGGVKLMKYTSDAVRFPVGTSYSFRFKPERGATWFTGFKPYKPKDVYILEINPQTGMARWYHMGPLPPD